MDKSGPRSDSTHPVVSLNNVTLRIGQAPAFADTNWTIYEGQQWVILGPNGSGKSLLAQAICGKTPLIEGEITYYLPPADRSGGASGSGRPRDRIAYLSFDSHRRALSPHKTFHQLRWNSGIGSGRGSDALSADGFLTAKHISRRNPYEVRDNASDPPGFEELRRCVIQRLQIAGLLGRKLIQLSNGEMRKVLIAQALLRQPQLLILDNPFTGLDQQFRQRLKEVIQSLIEDGTRLIVITGRPDEVPRGITHALLIVDKHVVQQGPCDEVLTSTIAQDLFTAETPQYGTCADEPEPRSHVGPDGEILIQMKSVSVSYGNAEVIRDLSWTVRKGQHWALLGPNGAGKTTLLSLIIGDHPQAYANEITLFGRKRGSGESIWEIKEHIGWVSSELHLYYPPQTSVIDTVCSGFFDSIGLFHTCTPRERDTARIWLARLGIHQRPDAPFGTLSHGEQRLVLTARALVKRPELLILDEPCQGLDEHNRRRLVRIVDDAMTQLEASLIYVTHEHDQLPTCITHVLRLP